MDGFDFFSFFFKIKQIITFTATENKEWDVMNLLNVQVIVYQKYIMGSFLEFLIQKSNIN